MSGLALLLLAAAGSAYGAWAALRMRPQPRAAYPSTLLFAAAGVAAVLASWIGGDGVVLPGLQLSPGLRAWYLAEVARDARPWVDRGLVLLAPLAHALLLLARRDRDALLRPLPATALFVWLFLRIDADEIRVVQARGPERVAYLTVARSRDGARLILAAGEPFSGFLDIVHEHETRSDPPDLRLYWTNDGEGLVVRVHEELKPAFAVDLEGRVTGAFPVEAREWPGPSGSFTPPDVQERFSRARRDVAEFVVRHGGLHPP